MSLSPVDLLPLIKISPPLSSPLRGDFYKKN
jgi:hypothetical protein